MPASGLRSSPPELAASCLASGRPKVSTFNRQEEGRLRHLLHARARGLGGGRDGLRHRPGHRLRWRARRGVQGQPPPPPPLQHHYPLLTSPPLCAASQAASGYFSSPKAALLVYCGGMAIAVGDKLDEGLKGPLAQARHPRRAPARPARTARAARPARTARAPPAPPAPPALGGARGACCL